MKPLRRKLLLSILPLALLATGLRANIPAPKTLNPTTDEVLATKLITGYIRHYHLKNPKLDDALSKQLFTHYLEELDPTRSYFLKSDIAAFAKYKTLLDNDLRAADLHPAFEIFRVFGQRLNERVNYVQQLLDRDFNFNVKERYVFDRSDKPWAADQDELNEIWRKRVKNDVLSLLLGGQKQDKIVETLHKRYARLGASISQFRAEDVYQLFISAYTQSIEPHTAYLPPRASEDFEIRMSLSLEGIGAVLQSENEHTIVNEIVPGGPADLSKQLHVGDHIIGVGQGADGKMVDVVGWRLDDVVALIRGPKDTKVRLQLLPEDANAEGTPQVITITRNKVKLENQAAQKSVIKIYTNQGVARIGLIRVPTFYMDYEAFIRHDPNYRSTTRDVRRLLDELKKADVEGIVIDLRGNGGGSLTEATQLTGLFIKSGPIVQIKGTTDRVEVLHDPDPSIAYNGPLAVLVDRGSASASEIFAGAIQDYRRGIIIGETTFGKGTVQKMVDLNQLIVDKKDQLGQLTTTIAQFYRVTGSSTQHRGVVPDIILPTSSDAEAEGESALDNALPWDAIHAANFAPRKLEANAIEWVRERHAHRIHSSPAFSYLLAEIAASQKAQAQVSVSLLEKQRRDEMEAMKLASLERENQFRKARHLPTRKTGQAQGSVATGFNPDQVLLHETAHILHDLIDSESRAPNKLQAADYRG
ncbi:MAG TPA: carboxy terminal-processing peptidase [Gammaproteobacteria bacterium]|nr:carboxy terminal-processing peptidase [Gammaproteobacteria bacterium]